MDTFNKMWGVVTPEEAAAKIEEQRKEITGEPKNLEEQAISLVGRDIYEKLIKGYTEKQCVNNNPKKPRIIGNRISVLDRLHIKLEERKQKSQPQQQQQQERSRKN